MDLTKAHLHWRVSMHNGKKYKSYSLARSVRENGKNRKIILLKLGKLTDQEAHQWKMSLKALKGNCSTLVPFDDIITKANYDYLDVAVLLEVWHSWNLNKVFGADGEREVPLWAVAAALTINRCVNPAAKSQVSTWFEGTALPYILNIKPSQMNSSRIFRELSAIDSLKYDLCDHLYQEVAKRDPPAMESVFYDLSSTTFSGTKCLLMDWGYCKEGFDNHMVLALVVNKKGLPIYWEVLPGCTSDVSTIEWLLRNLKDRLKIGTSTLVFDRGMVSDDNLKLLESNNIKYISAMDRNQIVNFADVDFESFSAITAEEVEGKVKGSNLCIKMNESTYHHEVKLKEGGRRYILCFNPQLCKDQRQARQEAIARFKAMVKEINQELLTAKNSRERESTLNKFKREMSLEQKGFLEIKLRQKTVLNETEKGIKKVHSYQGTIQINYQKMQDASRLDGFWLLVTNHNEQNIDGTFEMRTEAVIRPYKDKVVIESSFRDIKSFIEISPVHVWTIEHVKAHYTICVLAHLIDRTLTLRLHETPGDCSKDIYTHNKLYAALKKCLINVTGVKGAEVKKAGLTEPTSIQKELLDRIGLTHLLKEETVKKYCMAAVD